MARKYYAYYDKTTGVVVQTKEQSDFSPTPQPTMTNIGVVEMDEPYFGWQVVVDVETGEVIETGVEERPTPENMAPP